MPKTKSLSDMTDAENTAYWNKKAETILKGQTVKSARYMSDEHQKNYDWYAKGLLITFENGVEILVSSDDEGNAPGALFTNHVEASILPVLHR